MTAQRQQPVHAWQILFRDEECLVRQRHLRAVHCRGLQLSGPPACYEAEGEMRPICKVAARLRSSLRTNPAPPLRDGGIAEVV